MATPTLRPLSLGEILDAGIKLNLRHWKPLMACVVGLALPMQIFSTLVLASLSPDTLTNGGFNFDTTTSESQQLEDLRSLAIAEGIIAIVYTVLMGLAVAACFKGISDAWLGTAPEAGRSLRFAARRLPRLVGLSIVYSFGILLGLIPCGVVAIWLGVAWALSVPILLLEGRGVFASLGRSYRLTRGRWWAIFGILLVGTLLVYAITFAIEFAITLVPRLVAEGNEVVSAVAQVIAGTIGSVLTLPFLAAIVTLVYFDQRVRNEGFDLQLLAESLGEARDPDAPLPAPLVEGGVAPRAPTPYHAPPPGWSPRPPSGATPARGGAGWAPPGAESTPPDAQSWGRPGAEPAPPPPRGWAPPTSGPPAPSSGGLWSAREEERGDEAARDERRAEAQPEERRDEPPRDKRRAEWLPPEAPRGPGGL